MDQSQGKLQIGKNGVTDGFLVTLNNLFKNHGMVRLSVLKGSTRDKGILKEYVEKILNSLGNKYTAKTIGYTIIVKKWRKAIRE